MTEFNKGHPISVWKISSSTRIYRGVHLSYSYITYYLVGTLCTELPNAFLFYPNALKEAIIFWGEEEAYINFPIIAFTSSLDSQMTFFSLWSKEFEMLWDFELKFSSVQTVYFLCNFIYQHVLRKYLLITCLGRDELVYLFDFDFGHKTVEWNSFIFIP